MVLGGGHFFSRLAARPTLRARVAQFRVGMFRGIGILQADIGRLGGGFTDCLCSPLFGEDSHFD